MANKKDIAKKMKGMTMAGHGYRQTGDRPNEKGGMPVKQTGKGMEKTKGQKAPMASV